MLIIKFICRVSHKGCLVFIYHVNILQMTMQEENNTFTKVNLAVKGCVLEGVNYTVMTIHAVMITH